MKKKKKIKDYTLYKKTLIKRRFRIVVFKNN